MEKQKKVECWSYPFKAKDSGTAASSEVTDPQVYYDALALAESGYYPVASNGLWHGGVHFDQHTAARLDQSCVRCIADGMVVAYRIDAIYKKLTYTGSGTPKEVTYSTGFVLVKHRLELPPAPAETTPPAGEPDLTFFSLYMHLMDWDSYQKAGAPTPPIFMCPTPYAVSGEHATNDFSGLFVRGGAPRTPEHANKVAIIPKGCKVRVGEISSVDARWRKLVSLLEGQASPALAPEIEHWVFVGEMTPTADSDVFLIGERANDVRDSLLSGKGLVVRKEAKQNSAAMAVLPVGAQVRLEDGTGKYRKIKSIDASTLSSPLSAECASNIAGYIHFDSLKAVPPPTLNTVHILPTPVPIQAGALIGHLGKYQAASQSEAQDLLHLEVFSCDDVEAFVALSRTRANQLKPEQKTLLKIPHGTKVINKEGASQANPPRISDPGQPTAYDMILPLAVLHALPADKKITLTTTANGTTTTEQWWRLDNLPGRDGRPIGGWVREGELTTPRYHPWDWEGFDFIKETSTPSEQYVCKLRADGVLDDGERTNYQAQINTGDGGPVRERLYKIIDLNNDEKLTSTEIRDALAKPWHAQSISRLITEYESEWYADAGLSKWEALNCYMTKEDENDWDQEKNRIRSLLWLRDLMILGSSTLTKSSWHLHPITTVACFNSSCIPIVRAQEIALLVSSGYEGKAELDFEALAGNFDGQGMSFGVIQWNFGQGTLGPILKEMRDADTSAFDACFGDNMNLHTLISALNSGNQIAQFNWSTGIQSTNQPGWKQAFKNIGQVEQFKSIQLKHAAKYHEQVLTCINLMREIAPQHMATIELRTYVALYDLCIQQNNLNKAKQDIIEGYSPSNIKSQNELLIYVCKKRAERAASGWVSDCLSRRIGIIQGSTYTATANGLTSSRANPNFGKIIAGAVCEI